MTTSTTNTTSSANTIEAENLSLRLYDYLEERLNDYEDNFRYYFHDKCKKVINYFINAEVATAIIDWFFHAGNFSKFPLSAQDLFKNVEGLSRKTGMSYIKQFNLADKLERSSRWIRDIVSRLKSIGLIFSIKSDRINYCITFDLNNTVGEYFDTLINLMFDCYSTTNSNNTIINNASNNSKSKKSTEPSSKPLSTSSAEPQAKFSLASLLYRTFCDKSKRIEDLLSSINRINIKNIRGMQGKQAQATSQPASPSTSSDSSNRGEERKETTTQVINSNLNLSENIKTSNSTIPTISTNIANSMITTNTTINTHFTSVKSTIVSNNDGNKPNTENKPTGSNKEDKELPKSMYSFELCNRYTIAYAKFKLGLPTRDKIKSINGFAKHCYNTGREDHLIKLFVENNYTIIPDNYNSLQNNDVTANDTNDIDDINEHNQIATSNNTTRETNEHQNNSTITKNSEKEKPQDSDEKDLVPMGKYGLAVYMDFIEKVERPRLKLLRRKVGSVEGLANHMRNTGADDARVDKFVELTKTASIGGNATNFTYNKFSFNELERNSRQSDKSRESKNLEYAKQIKEDYDYLIEMESLKASLWSNLSENEQQLLLKKQVEGLRTSRYFNSHYRTWSKSQLEEHAVYQIQKELVENFIIQAQATN